MDGWFLPERAAFLLTANSVVLWILWSRTLKEFLKPKSDWHFHRSLPTTYPVVGALRNNIPAGLSFHDRSFLARCWVLLLFQTMLDQIELFNFSTILEKKNGWRKNSFLEKCSRYAPTWENSCATHKLGMCRKYTTHVGFCWVCCNVVCFAALHFVVLLDVVTWKD